MKPRKPDRFDQIAADNIEWHTPAGTPMVSSYEVAKLLRNEHAWMMRMVKRRQRYIVEDGVMVPFNEGKWVMGDLIIEELAQRRK